MRIARASVLRRRPWLRWLHTTPYHPLALSRWSTPKTDKFIENTPAPTSLTQAIHDMMQCQPDFLNPSHKFGDYDHEELSPQIPEKLGEQLLAEMIEDNYNLPPTRGSIVEYYLWGKPTSNMGIVVRDVQLKFNENYNTVVVLLLENELEFVSGQQVTFHWHGVVDNEWLGADAVMENRFDETFPLRQKAVNLVNHFVSEVERLATVLSPEVERVHAQYAQSHQAVAVGLVQMIDSCRFPDDVLPLLWRSYWHQQIVVGGLRLAVCRLARWLVPQLVLHGPLLVWHETNAGSNHCLNEVIKRPVFLANLVENTAALATLASDLNQPEALKRYENFIKTTVANLPDDNRVSHLTAWFNIWDGKHFHPLLTVLKLVAIYPHPEAITTLSKLSQFANPNQTTALDFLREIGLYSDDTDTYRSANLAGQLPNLALVTDRNDQYQDNSSLLTLSPDDLTDKFRHLRQQHRFGAETPLFVVPLGVAVLLEKVNTRNYKVNIHTPDVMARLCPNLDEFDDIIGTKSLVLAMDIAHDLGVQFRAQGAEVADYMTAHQLWHKQPQPRTNATAMTLLLAYNTYELNPFKELELKVLVTFDSLNLATIKCLSVEELEECLAGKLEPSPLRLFRPRDPQPLKLLPSDCHDLRFIYLVLQTHFKVRNHQGALAAEPGVDINERARLFTEEIDHLASAIAANFAQHHQLAMVYETQLILDSVGHDLVLVAHHNQFLPQYLAQLFYQTLLARDHRGYVSKPAEVIGTQFLASPRLLVAPEMHQRYGAIAGHCAITTGDGTAVYLNQLQLLYHVHRTFLSLAHRRKYSYLRGYGYRQLPMLARLILELLAQVQRSLDQGQCEARASRAITGNGNNDSGEMASPKTVVITHGGEYCSQLEHRILMAYHPELDREVMVLTKPDLIFQLGGMVDVEQVYRDPYGRYTVFVEVE